MNPVYLVRFELNPSAIRGCCNTISLGLLDIGIVLKVPIRFGCDRLARPWKTREVYLEAAVLAFANFDDDHPLFALMPALPS
jgi:hypothetical protein